MGYSTQQQQLHQQQQNQYDSPSSATSKHPLHPRTGTPNGYSAKSPYTPGGYGHGPPGDRTPSPTPSELEDMKRGVVDWKKLFNWRTYAKKQYIIYYVILIVIVTLVALMTIYHKEIVLWLKPAAQWMESFKFGWLIPIAVLFVISFPPLFGHEIVAVLCGLVWGLWIGFAIVAAGTLLGEIGNFYAFKWCLSARGEKMEKTKLSYACLARVVREGGFKIALIARLSAIPGHFTTAVFATCGMGIFVFTLAAILSMPKQFITVYLGVILEHSADSAEEQAKDKNSKIISNVVLAVTVLITVAAMWYIWREMNLIKPAVLRDRRAAKKKLAASSMEGAYLSRASNLDVSSEDELGRATPVKFNEPGMGGYGYGGYGHASFSTDTLAAPGRRSNAAGNAAEEWPMSERRNDVYPPQQRQQQSDQYYNGDNEKRDQPYGQSYVPAAASLQQPQPQPLPPRIDTVSNLTGPRRLERETWEVSEGSTVGMGSWGGILRDGSESQQQHQQQASQQSYQQQYTGGPDEYGRGGGLSALGAPMGGGDTLMVTSKNVSARRESRETTGQGHAAGRSMRAVIEGHDHSSSTDDYSDLAYARNSHAPDYSDFSGGGGGRGYSLQDPGFGSASGHGSQQPSSVDNGRREPSASAGTFGDGRSSLHSREYATSGNPGNERDEPFVPPLTTNRR